MFKEEIIEAAFDRRAHLAWLYIDRVEALVPAVLDELSHKPS